ncbi:MAG: depupylase/deamidase Dop [Acidimicrobiales bacterium]
MAIPKVIGIETELGIMMHGTDDWNPVSASSLVINAYAQLFADTHEVGQAAVSWDFESEAPGADARAVGEYGFAYPPEVETQMVNTVLTNGARYYVDHAHPEISTPECATALSALLYDRAGELIAADSMAAADRRLAPGQRVVLYKDNSDRKGNAYGCHENYLLDRLTPFPDIVAAATTHFVTRQIYTGSGKVGTELPGVSSADIPYQITQRAEHFEEEVGLETTLKRPIVNTRDEPHADASKYRRLHVIVGDATMSQVATFLKVGATSVVFAMLEDGVLRDLPRISDPVRALIQVSHDLSLRQPLRLSTGKTASALDLQIDLYERALRWSDEFGLDSIGGADAGQPVLAKWGEILAGLAHDPMTLADQLDWVAKRRIVQGFQARHDCAGDDPRLRLLDLQYHDLRPGKSLAARAGLQTLVDDAEARRACTEPPIDTRAYFRGRCLAKYPRAVVSANWDSMVFDIGDDSLRRVPMLEPTRGTAAHVGTMLDESSTASELLGKLGA